MTGAFQADRGQTQCGVAGQAGGRVHAGVGREDHLRRHGKYLADGFREWATALGVVLRGVAASLTLLTLCVVVLGLGLNAFYRRPRSSTSPGSSPVRRPAGRTIPASRRRAPRSGDAGQRGGRRRRRLVVFMVRLLASSRTFLVAQVARNVFRAAVGITGVVAVYAVVVPAVVWVMTWLTWATGSRTGAGRLLHRDRHHPADLVRRPGQHDRRRTEKVRASGAKLGLRGLLGGGQGRGGRAGGSRPGSARP